MSTNTLDAIWYNNVYSWNTSRAFGCSTIQKCYATDQKPMGIIYCYRSSIPAGSYINTSWTSNCRTERNDTNFVHEMSSTIKKSCNSSVSYWCCNHFDRTFDKIIWLFCTFIFTQIDRFHVNSIKPKVKIGLNEKWKTPTHSSKRSLLIERTFYCN